MTDISKSALLGKSGQAEIQNRTNARIKRRYAAEQRFRLYGVIAIVLAMSALFWLLASITTTGYQAFVQTYIKVSIHFDPEVIDPKGTRDAQTLRRADYAALYKKAIRARFPEVKSRRDRRALTRLIADAALRARLGAAGQDIVHKNFSLEPCIESLAARFGLAPAPAEG